MIVRLVLMGAPGAGKGTQAAFLKEHFSALHVSTGDLFRKAMKEKTALGEKARQYIDAGLLVPDEIVIDLVHIELENVIKEQPFIFDGYPRTIPQAESFAQVLQGMGHPLTAVISLEVSQDVLIHRISGRRLCPKCGVFYHVDSLSGQNVCPVDQTTLIQRTDDAQDAVKTRLNVFAKQTLPLKAFYQKNGLLMQIDGSGTPEAIFARILSSLKAVLTKNSE